MAKVTRIQAGQYSVDDGRFIVKQGSGWLVLTANGSHDFGPVPTLASAKQYVESGTTPLGQHNLSTKHGRRQSKKRLIHIWRLKLKMETRCPQFCGLLFFS
ncbi:TPA: hypothetical protein ACPVYE_000989 [Vibrio parahaemolyticus]